MLTNDEVSAWIAALRSGEYIQGFGAMCRETQSGARWCPLGVLVNEIWAGDWVLSDDRDLWWIETPELCWGRPPESVGKVATEVMNQIITRNDHSRLSFRAIADWIESRRDELTKGGVDAHE